MVGGGDVVDCVGEVCGCRVGVCVYGCGVVGGVVYFVG